MAKAIPVIPFTCIVGNQESHPLNPTRKMHGLGSAVVFWAPKFLRTREQVLPAASLHVPQLEKNFAPGGHLAILHPASVSTLQIWRVSFPGHRGQSRTTKKGEEEETRRPGGESRREPVVPPGLGSLPEWIAQSVQACCVPPRRSSQNVPSHQLTWNLTGDPPVKFHVY